LPNKATCVVLPLDQEGKHKIVENGARGFASWSGEGIGGVALGAAARSRRLDKTQHKY